jgi:putative phage-type endonuclease
MATVYEEHNSREDWLNARGGHIGASEAGAILGYGFMSKIDLWKIKTGRAVAKDLSDNEAVSYGNRAEPALRDLFMAKHPELQLFYRPYDFVYQEERPWLRATLDGELLDEDNDRGILEIKTATLKSKADWQKWNGRVPDGYLGQISHQLLATEATYVYLFAELTGANGDSTLREYLFLREDMEDNMAYLLQEEEKFWKCVETDTIPSTPLRI